MHASHPFFSSFIVGWIPLQCSRQFDWLVVKITWSGYQLKRWLVLTFAVMFRVWNLSFHVTKQLAIWEPSTFSGKKCKFHQMPEFCISQGTVATFFSCGGQVQKRLCRISSGFCVPKIIQIGIFLMGVIQNIKIQKFS